MTCLPFGVLVSSTAASESVCSRSCLCRGDLRRVKCGGLYFCRVPCRGRAGSGVDMTVRGGEGQCEHRIVDRRATVPALLLSLGDRQPARQ